MHIGKPHLSIRSLLWRLCLLIGILFIPGCAGPPPSFIASFFIITFAIMWGIVTIVLWLLAGNARSALSALMYLITLMGPFLGFIGHLLWVQDPSYRGNTFRTALARSTIGAICFGLLFSFGQLVLGWPGIVTAMWWGCGMLLYLLVLLLGFFVISDQAAFLLEDIQESFKQEKILLYPGKINSLGEFLVQRIDRLHGKQSYHYLAFLISPFIVFVLYQFGLLQSSVVFYWQFAVAAGLMIICILVTTVLVGSSLGESRDPTGNGISPSGIKTWYRLEYECRMLYFIDIIHSILVATIYGLAFLLATHQSMAQSDLLWPAIWVVTGIVVFVVVFVILPFYVGQLQSARRCALAIQRCTSNNKPLVTLDSLFRELIEIRPLVPKSVPMKYLVVAITAGGLASALLGKAFGLLVK